MHNLAKARGREAPLRRLAHTTAVCVRAQVMAGSRLMRAERWFLYALIPLTLALSVAGVYSSVAELVDKVRSQ